MRLTDRLYHILVIELFCFMLDYHGITWVSLSVGFRNEIFLHYRRLYLGFLTLNLHVILFIFSVLGLYFIILLIFSNCLGFEVEFYLFIIIFYLLFIYFIKKRNFLIAFIGCSIRKFLYFIKYIKTYKKWANKTQ